MVENNLNGKLILITGAARRIGKIFALSCARHGADVIIHHGHSEQEAISVQEEIRSMGRRAEILQADLNVPRQVAALIDNSAKLGPIFGLVNSAAMFKPLSVEDTSFEEWEDHLNINLTAPFLLSQRLARHVEKTKSARIINILDWRALRPTSDHFPYTITKAALAAMTKSLARALAPNILVNGLALGAVLPPSDGEPSPDLLKSIPAGRWAAPEEIESALFFLLAGPAYITGEIIHVDGGRHLV
jgi:NAD(P)-dependent dehydrogenase (short-subunit alcohol dehydrogenase family)